jgi:hypothetical protein
MRVKADGFDSPVAKFLSETESRPSPNAALAVRATWC